MSFDSNDVKKITRLSRIKIDDNQLDSYTQDLTKVLGFVETLSELDTKDVEPMTGAVDLTQNLRDDIVNDGNYPERVVENATDSTMNFFTVPKVVE